MNEKSEAATVTIMFFEGRGDDKGVITIQATTVTWVTEDMGIARTLREQLSGLLGDPANETIQPWISTDVAEGFQNPWPGTVQFGFTASA